LPAWADTLRVATFNAELSRNGPGLLLRDILKGTDAQITAVLDLLVQTNADVITLQGFDYDLENRALIAFADALEKRGLHYPHRFAAPPNAGFRTGLDLNGDGRRGGPDDAQGYGRFFGAGSMAVLSRFVIERDEVQDFTSCLRLMANLSQVPRPRPCNACRHAVIGWCRSCTPKWARFQS
jgi:hypothetical protein